MRYVIITPTSDTCPCCSSGPCDPIYGRDDNVCRACADRGMHQCGEPTRAGTPCKHWTSDEACPQHREASEAA